MSMRATCVTICIPLAIALLNISSSAQSPWVMTDIGASLSDDSGSSTSTITVRQ